MAIDLNTVSLSGNLTRDPELRALPSGSNVCSMRIAVNERRKDSQGQWQDQPNFFNVSVFAGLADNCAKFLSRGRPVAVTGRLRWREWQDQQGNKRESVEVVADNVRFFGGTQGAGGPQQSSAPVQQSHEQFTPASPVDSQTFDAPPSDDDIPF